MRWLSGVRVIVGAAAAAVGLVLVAPVLILGAPLWVIAGIARGLRPLFERRVVRWPELFVPDRTLGWRAKPNLDVICDEDRADSFRLVTDVNGWAGRLSVAESDVVVIGDSIAFGYGIDPEQSFAARAGGLRVKGVGVPGYSMVQELLVMRTIAPKLAGKLVVWLVCQANDLYDNLAPESNGYRAPFVARTAEDDGWEIVTRHVRAERWRASAGRRGSQYLPTLAALHAPTAAADRAYGACEYLIGEGQRLVAEAGARLVVVGVPTPLSLDEGGLAWLRSRFSAPETIDASYPDRRLAAICAALGVAYVALRDRQTRGDYYEYDDHWTEHGHRGFAALLRELYYVNVVTDVAARTSRTVQAA